MRLIARAVTVVCTGICSPSRPRQVDAGLRPRRQRFLEMFARSYFPGRTGQLMIVPREGDFITRRGAGRDDYMHGSPGSTTSRFL